MTTTEEMLHVANRRLARLREEAKKAKFPYLRSNYAGSRNFADDPWKHYYDIEVGLQAQDEDELGISPENESRAVRAGSYRFITWAGLIRIGCTADTEFQLLLNARNTYEISHFNRAFVPWLPSGMLGIDLQPTINNQEVSGDDVIGLFRQYTDAISAMLDGATVVEALGRMALPDHLAEPAPAPSESVGH